MFTPAMPNTLLRGVVRCVENSPSGRTRLRDNVGNTLHALSVRDIMRYLWRCTMTDVLIRDVPDAVLAAVDARASRLGLSRVEYIRRRLAADAQTSDAAVSVDDLERFGRTFADVNDAEVMDQAWR